MIIGCIFFCSGVLSGQPGIPGGMDTVHRISQRLQSLFWEIPVFPVQEKLQQLLSDDSTFYSLKVTEEKGLSHGMTLTRIHCYFNKWKAFGILPKTANQLDIIVSEDKEECKKNIQVNFALNERGIARKMYYWINKAFADVSAGEESSDDPSDSKVPAKAYMSKKYYSSAQAKERAIKEKHNSCYLIISIMEFKNLQPSNWGKLEITIFDRNLY
jgi:hypothetical protein